MVADDFDFNAILWYYTVEDINGVVTNNLYGISILDNPDNNINPSNNFNLNTNNKRKSFIDKQNTALIDEHKFYSDFIRFMFQRNSKTCKTVS